jgi:hypothetical protein
MASNDSPRPITLFCWILGVSDRPFSVTIEDNRTVDDLKKAIVKEKPNAFTNVDPDQLTLWKVCGVCLSIAKVNNSTLQESVPIDRTLKNEVTKLQFLDEDALFEARRLSKVFSHPDPVEETLHIVVRAPPVGMCSLCSRISPYLDTDHGL